MLKPFNAPDFSVTDLGENILLELFSERQLTGNLLTPEPSSSGHQKCKVCAHLLHERMQRGNFTTCKCPKEPRSRGHHGESATSTKHSAPELNFTMKFRHRSVQRSLGKRLAARGRALPPRRSGQRGAAAGALRRAALPPASTGRASR